MASDFVKALTVTNIFMVLGAKLNFLAPIISSEIYSVYFLCAKAAAALAHLSHRNSVYPSVRPSHGWISQKRCITESSPSATWKTLVLGTVKLFHKFEGGLGNRKCYRL